MIIFKRARLDWAKVGLVQFVPTSVRSYLGNGGQSWRQNTRKEKVDPGKRKRKRKMFGRVRAASSTPDELELERSPSKLIKDDFLSIYEATLMKLKLGAQRDVASTSKVSMKTETDCGSSTVSKCCSDGLSSNFAEATCRSHALLKSSQLVSLSDDITMTDTDGSSESVSPSSSDCQSTGSMKHHRSNDVSVLYLFSKYRSLGQVKSSSQEEAIMIENGGSSVSISPSSSDGLSMKTTNEQLERDCICSFPVFQM